jgi:hypothetical protein
VLGFAEEFGDPMATEAWLVVAGGAMTRSATANAARAMASSISMMTRRFKKRSKGIPIPPASI